MNINAVFINKNINKVKNLILIFLIIIRGIIFWTEERRIKIYKELVFKIEINHTWKGATPNFINILIIIRIYILFIYVKKKNLRRKIIEAQLWTKKYFIEFSNSIDNLDEMIGKNLNIFNSRLIHIKKFELILKEKTIDINNKK